MGVGTSVGVLVGSGVKVAVFVGWMVGVLVWVGSGVGLGFKEAIKSQPELKMRIKAHINKNNFFIISFQTAVFSSNCTRE